METIAMELIERESMYFDIHRRVDTVYETNDDLFVTSTG
jgi:hypothetical protein